MDFFKASEGEFQVIFTLWVLLFVPVIKTGDFHVTKVLALLVFENHSSLFQTHRSYVSQRVPRFPKAETQDRLDYLNLSSGLKEKNKLLPDCDIWGNLVWLGCDTRSKANSKLSLSWCDDTRQQAAHITVRLRSHGSFLRPVNDVTHVCRFLEQFVFLLFSWSKVLTCLGEHRGLDIHRVAHQRSNVGIRSLDLLHAQSDDSTVQLQESTAKNFKTFDRNKSFSDTIKADKKNYRPIFRISEKSSFLWSYNRTPQSS